MVKNFSTILSFRSLKGDQGREEKINDYKIGFTAVLLRVIQRKIEPQISMFGRALIAFCDDWLNLYPL